MISPVLHEQFINQFVNVTDADAIAAMRLMARTRGLLIGQAAAQQFTQHFRCYQQCAGCLWGYFVW